MNNVKWLFFDFGGCLDSDGVHSRTLFYNQFINNDIITHKDSMEFFQNAYTLSDNAANAKSLVLNSSLSEMNNIMCTSIANNLHFYDQNKILNTAKDISNIQAGYLQRNRPILKELKLNYKLGVVSNFTGNLEIILKEFSIDSVFSFVLDSYHVGYSKPNPEIFKLAISKCEVLPNEICFIGDNLERDIIPAKKLGMKTVLITQHGHQAISDWELDSIEKLLDLAQIK
ncbi:MAG: HAD family hydrolase [Bacteriovorax sp.]|nr:HAD family hydrolase [Bacteriovorax sp.]